MLLSPQNSRVEILMPPGHTIGVRADWIIKSEPSLWHWCSEKETPEICHGITPEKSITYYPRNGPHLPVPILNSSSSRTLRKKFLVTNYPVCAFLWQEHELPLWSCISFCMWTMTNTHLQRWVCGLNETHVSKVPNMVSGTKDSKRPCTPWLLLAHLRIRCLEIPAVGITQALIGPFTTGITWTITLSWCPKNNQKEREGRSSSRPQK